MFRIQSLGGVAVTDARGNPIHLRSRKHLGLLLYLASGGKRLFTREVLATLLWSTEAQRSRHSLSQAIYDLRRNLDGALIRGPGEDIRLDPSRVLLDALEFEAAVKAGDLARGVELYRGPFGDNLAASGTPDFERWIEGERLRYARMAEFVLRRHVRESNDAGRWGEMCVAALKLVKLNVLDEEAHRALMRGLWMHGDATSALRHYEETAPLLERELTGGISEETRDLARRIESAPNPRRHQARFVDREPPFLGREVEFEFLQDAVRSIGRARTTAILVYGEPGIGKTRLLREFAPSLLLERVHLLESRCYPAESEVPYGPIVESLRPIATEVARTLSSDSQCFTRLGHLLPEFEHLCRPHDEGIDPAAWRRRLYEEVASLVRQACSARPIVWVIEDLHWIDATSASLLHYITRRLEGEKFLLIASMRVARGQDLSSELPLNAPGPNGLTKALRLSPLADEDIRQIVLHLRPEADRHPAVGLAQHLSAGNPFLALEVFRAAMDSLDWAEQAQQWAPLTDSRLGRVLAVRFQGLSRAAVRLLHAVAVLERQATPAAVATVAGGSLADSAERSEELYERGLIQDREGRLEFANDIIREYVYAEMSALERAALHLSAAEHLSREPDANSAMLARHYHRGDDRERSCLYALRAAREAAASGGHSEAVAMASLALSTARTGEERLVALNLLAESELGSAQLTKATEHFEQILRLDEAMPLERRIEVKLRLVRALAESAQWARGTEVLRGITDAIRRIEDPSHQLFNHAETLYWSLKIAIRQNDPLTARRVAETARALRDRAIHDGSLTADARASAMVCMAAYSTFFESSHRAMCYMGEIAGVEGALSPTLLERVHLFKGMIAIRMANWDTGEHEIRRALELATRRQDSVQLSSLWNNLACCALEQGKWEDFADCIEKAQACHSTPADPLDADLPLRINRANALFYQGKAREAGSGYAEACRIAAAVGSREFVPELLACRGLVALQVGNSAEVSSVWSELAEVGDDQLAGSQERFKLEWLRAYITKQADMRLALDRLVEEAQALEYLDFPSHLKLIWLGLLLFNQTAMQERGYQQEEWYDRLRNAGMVWFSGFGSRWMRATARQRLFD